MKEEKNPKEYIPLQEAAKYCHYSQEYLSLRARQGKLRSLKFGRNWVTKKEWLEEYEKKVKEFNSQKNNKNNHKKELLIFKKKQPTPLLRWGFLTALVFVLFFSSLIFGKDSFKNIYPSLKDFSYKSFNISDAYVKKFNEKADNFLGTFNKLGMAEAREAGGGVFKNYFSWFQEKITGLGRKIVQGHSDTNESIEDGLKNSVFSVSRRILGISKKIGQGYIATNNFIENKISTAINWLSESGKRIVEKIKGGFSNFAKTWRSPSEISVPGEKIVEKTTIKEVEVERITRIEPIKEITKIIKTIDEGSLKKIQATFSLWGDEILNLKKTDENLKTEVATKSTYSNFNDGTPATGSTTIATVGTITGGIWQGNTIGTFWGGTGQNFSLVPQGSIIYFSGAGNMATLAPGAAGQALITGGLGANPVWGAAGLASFARTVTKTVCAFNSLDTANCDYLCDGVNDHVQIQVAIDALPATGGEIRLLDGTYNVEVTINLDTNQTIRGNGKNTILTTSTADLVFLSAVGGAGTEKTGIAITDLQIDGGAGGISDAGIFFNYVDYSFIQNIYSRRHTSGAGSHISGVHLLNSDFNQIVNNTCQGNGVGIRFITSTNNIVSGNTCQGNIDAGIYFYTSTNNTISGNTCQGNDFTGIFLDTSANNIVSDNTLTENSQDTTNDSDDIYLGASDYNNIQGNTCRAGALVNKPRYGINIDDAASDGNLVINNDIYNDAFGTSSLNDSGTGTIKYGNRTGTGATEEYIFNVKATSANTALTVTQISTGKITDLIGDAITTGTGLSVSVDGLTTGTGVDISSTSTVGTGASSTKLLNLARSGANANASHTAYGLYSSVTNTGTTSTNIAGYFSASGAINNYGLIVNAGNVGIGITTPTGKFHAIAPDGTNNTGFSFIIDNQETSSDHGNTLLVKGGAHNSSQSTLEVQDKNGNIDFVVRGDGNVGIGGETSPAAKLEVAQTDAANDEAIIIDTEESTSTQNIFSIISDVGGNETTVFNIDADGLITNGIWSGTAITVAKGGTNLTTIAAGSILAANALDTLSAVTSVADLKVLQNNAGAISWASTTGTGSVVYSISPTITSAGASPALTVTQSSTGNIATLTGDSITTGIGLELSVDGLTTGTGLDISSTSTAGTGASSTKLLNITRSGANSNASHTAYGLYSSVTNTGTTSTNIAGYFSVSGATNNYAAIFENGNVGIGTTEPDRRLDILDASNAQLRLTQADSSVYNEFQSKATTGDLEVTTAGTGKNIVFLDNTLKVCEGNACPAITGQAGTGDLIIENQAYFSGDKIIYPNDAGWTRPKRSIILTASGAIPPTAGGAAQTKIDGTNQTYYALEYDADSDEAAYWQWAMPDSYDDGTIDITYYWTAAANTNNVVWCFQARGVSAGEAVDAALSASICETGAAPGTTQYLVSTTESAAASNFTKGEEVAFKVFRDADNGSDTMAGDARLLKVKIEYSVSQETD